MDRPGADRPASAPTPDDAPPADFAAALAAGPLVLDGGLSERLASAGFDLADALWSARLLADAPEAVVAAHRAFFEAGARVAITASYQASFAGFARRGVGRAAAARLMAGSVELAREAARGLPGPRRWVAASVGPYGAVLADGSEYRGRYGLTPAELEAFHRPRLEVLAAAGPDVLALETVPDVDEARVLLRAVRGLGVPVWLSFAAAGGRTRAGQPLAEAFALAAGADEVVAVGVNCCAPEEADRAVALAARVSGKPVVVYPNSGEGWDPAAGAWCGEPAFGAAGPPRAADGRGGVAGWLADGARLVGGCCRVGPAGIRAVAAGVAAATGERDAGKRDAGKRHPGRPDAGEPSTRR
ncbi:homocysteine S-methyltransferase [Streptomyces sp. TLI_053]|uniref:homocysteine S-methyltransferase n=1 Tax=Streptomyces sp. TLI_053 TaxID=1855352 RepID=UPI00087DACCA|nr:homocysteine S-methyltransferase [Streptomyces sp. TLI_053]SDT22698.1 homocysteine S-methyltransferase [Streptomyces sp. TLI_053]